MYNSNNKNYYFCHFTGITCCILAKTHFRKFVPMRCRMAHLGAKILLFLQRLRFCALRNLVWGLTEDRHPSMKLSLV